MRLLRVLLPDDSPAAMPLAVACTPESFDPFLYRLVDPYFDATVEDPMDAERRDADYAAILRALIAHTRDSNPTADWLIDNPNGFTYEHAPKCIAILEQVYQRRVTKHQLSQWNLRRNLAYILLHYAHLFSEQWLRPTGEWSRKRLPIVVVCLAWKDVNETWAIEEGILHMLIIRTLKALELVPLRSLTRRDFIKQGVGRLLQEAYNGMFCVSKGSVGNISWDQAALQEAQDRMRRRLVYLGLDALPFVSMTSEDRHSQSPRHIDWSRFRPT
ncbi:hypothetical protein EUX98_g2111 [Antrodiella citrinella]|uniref:Uncharacterized protein n=1 Tax=Antrodiella citrinella TaxID=2447956 RepID=A0A4S4MZU7_9APHY|nr:hypothetical protein EUX98_g2111 [Antrodiella citrinella]